MNALRDFGDTDILFVHDTQPPADDCPAVREHLEAQRQQFRASMARLAQAIHPDDTVPAELYVRPHRPQLGYDLLHRHPYWCGLVLGMLCGAIAAGVL